MNADIEEFTNDNTAAVVPSTTVQNNTVLNDALNLNTTSSDHDGSQVKEIRNSIEMAEIASSLQSNSSLRNDPSRES